MKRSLLRSRRAVFSILAMGLMGLAIASLSTVQPQSITPAADPWSVLQRGQPGLVVLLRHAIAPGTGDPPGFKLSDCSTQRNLSAAGRQQAVRIGQAFRQRRIAIARVRSSQWCRCLETAKLINLGTVEPTPALNSFFENPDREAAQTAALRQLILNHRTSNAVLILVTHQVNITALTGIIPASGAAVVLQADRQGNIQQIGELPAF
jgi:phosphohistidine phosphatase SixA